MSEHREQGDLRIVARYVDGELAAVQRAEVERRLVAEPELRAAVDELRGLRGLFAPERDAAAPKATAGFRERVLGEVRRLPSADELRADETSRAARLEGACRQLMVAAAVLIVVGVAAFAGLIQRGDTGRLDASHAEIRLEMERLDALIRAESPDRR